MNDDAGGRGVSVEIYIKTYYMENFKSRRENIMNIFSQAKQDLEQLNAEIDTAIVSSKEKIAAMQAEISELTSLKTNNENSIKSFVKIFKL